MEETPAVDPQIVETPTEPQDTASDNLAGVPEGTILQTPPGVPDERVVIDRDENGNEIGWHKEVVSG